MPDDMGGKWHISTDIVQSTMRICGGQDRNNGEAGKIQANGQDIDRDGFSGTARCGKKATKREEPEKGLRNDSNGSSQGEQMVESE